MAREYNSSRTIQNQTTRENIQELDGIELLTHPAYDADLAPSDYHIVRSLAHFLQGSREQRKSRRRYPQILYVRKWRHRV